MITVRGIITVLVLAVLFALNFVQGDKTELREWNPPKTEGGYAIMEQIYGTSDVGAA